MAQRPHLPLLFHPHPPILPLQSTDYLLILSLFCVSVEEFFEPYCKLFLSFIPSKAFAGEPLPVFTSSPGLYDATVTEIKILSGLFVGGFLAVFHLHDVVITLWSLEQVRPTMKRKYQARCFLN